MTADREKTIANGWYSHIKFKIFQNTMGLFLNLGRSFNYNIRSPGAENLSKFHDNPVMAPLEAT